MKDNLFANKNFQRARQHMVREHLQDRGISDRRLLQIMGRLPRERFVPASQRDRAYEDSPLPISCGQTISQPYIVALMTQLLKLQGAEKVLEIGTGSGYQTAILAALSRAVYSMERFPELSAEARIVLAELGSTNIQLTTGDGTLGWQEEAPFDRIVVTAAAPALPVTLRQQLAEGGLLVVPVGDRFQQDLKIIRRQGQNFQTESGGGCVFVPLIGQEGWLDE